jgi:hypothetical protein
VVRKSVAAMALTLAIYVVIQVAVPLWVRPHLIPPTSATTVIKGDTLDGIMADGSGPFEITTQAADPRDWILTNETVDANGAATALPAWFADCLPPPPAGGKNGGVVEATPSRDSLEACFARLTDEGYRQHVVYHSYRHFWRLQWAELGLYLTASGLLAGLSFWWTRRRLS